MTDILTPPFFPAFGGGAPGAGVPTDSVYYDTSTNPYTPYIYHAGGWVAFGATGSGVNASSIQGVPVDATPPTTGQALVYNGTKWIPGPAGLVVPTIVQNAANGGAAINSVTLGAAPTQGNLLISFGLVNGNGATGAWNILNQHFDNDWVSVCWKIAGASESATQTPQSGNSQLLGIYELTPGCDLGYLTDKSAGNAADAVAIPCASVNGVILGALFAYTASGPTSISNATLDATHTNAATKMIQLWHSTMVVGNNSCTVTYPGATTKSMVLSSFYP